MSDALDPELSLPSDGFVRNRKEPKVRWDDDVVDPEASTYLFATHGPEPPPPWVITEDAARQRELGMLKTGKEADVHLVERRVGDRVNILAAKRYRSLDERMFRNDARYRQSRRTGIRRVDLAMARGTRAGMAFRADQWVQAEFDALCRLWAAGVSVPYPVQRLGHEIMVEYLGDESGAAPRLVATKPSGPEAEALFAQLMEILARMAALGVVHGDLSPYNLLVWHGRLYAIDFPQAVDPILNPDGMGLLERDVANCCSWFAKRGVESADPGRVLSEVAAWVFSR
ncbi:MAG TPA: RIO1 family regulatory kinase/ATPase [Acidimicrobiales bacterium]|nr:RIO1 family regulatory kinase/ATPase [Acidimicrobiales bacterium]